MKNPVSTLVFMAMMRRVMTSVFALIVLLSLSALSGCEKKTDPSAPATSTTKPAAAASSEPAKRIISLAPSITQMILALGHGDWIIGVAQYDTLAPKNVPVVGNFLELDSEKILSLKPDMVITVTGKAGVPQRLVELSKIGGFEVVSFPFPESVSEICEIYALGNIPTNDANSSQLPARRSVGELLGCNSKALEHTRIMIKQFQQLLPLSYQKLARPKVLMIIGTAPIMASGPGTVLDELLNYAGGQNAAKNSPVRAPTYDRESLLALQPDVILYLLPEAPPLGTPATDIRLADFRDLDIPAMKNHRVYLINDPLVHLQGTNVVNVAAQMAKAIHPEISKEIDRMMNNASQTVATDTAP